MWAYPFMVNAFRAGTIVAVVAGVIGWFMVLRRQTFAGHTLAVSASPGPPAPCWSGSAPLRLLRILRRGGGRDRAGARGRAAGPGAAGSASPR